MVLDFFQNFHEGDLLRKEKENVNMILGTTNRNRFAFQMTEDATQVGM